jgi:hypothetical protein
MAESHSRRQLFALVGKGWAMTGADPNGGRTGSRRGGSDAR